MKRPRNFTWTLVGLGMLLAGGLPPGASAQSSEVLLSLDDFLNWEEIESSAISPDGRQVIYTRKSVDPIEDRWRSESWIVNADGTRNRFLMKETGVVWSPDGTRIAYVAPGEPRGPQIFVRWMDAEASTTQITHLIRGPSQITWSPDGRSIAFVMSEPIPPEPWDLEMPSPPPGANWVAPPRLRGTGYPGGQYRHIHVVDAEGGTPRKITDGPASYGQPTWSPDGSTIFASGGEVSGAFGFPRRTNIYSIDVATRERRAITSGRGRAGGPAVSPDGRRVAYTWRDSTHRFVNPEVRVMNADGSNGRDVMGDLDRSPGGLWWAPDNSGLYFGAQDRGTVNLFFAPVSGEGARAVTEGDHLLQPHGMSRDGRMVALRSDPVEAGDLAVFDLDRPSDIRQITDIHADVLDHRQLGETEEIWYTSYDGLEIQGWIVKPPGFDPSRRYPFVLGIHGGPHAMYGFGASPVGGSTYYWFDWQYLASRGYVVLYTNPRGSTGYGAPFADAITDRYPGEGDYQDLMHGVDEVIGRGYVDTDNMFVFGCSGGGILTSWVVSHTDRFAAASANCTVSNWLSFESQRARYGFWSFRFWEDPTRHLAHSPIMRVDDVTTPTMLIAGGEDENTPPNQAEEFYNGLRYLGIPTALVVLNDEGHGLHDRPSNYMRAWAMMHSWFQRWSTGDAVSANGR
ncbi:S9 family peptidase [Candidatus Palauibacter sp.]|uniref:S9 family peptidase n=1 Tax=Candidatus Palauibacter sp. TaxID=3101350 RepID=UPI003B01C811